MTVDLAAIEPAALPEAAGPWTKPPTVGSILFCPLPEMQALDRMLVRGMALISRGRMRGLSGLEHIGPEKDPFILVLNHSSYQEALLVPALLFLLRRGRRIHFLADWHFRMIPGVNLLYRRGGVVTVTRKPARLRVLNGLKPLFADALPPIEQARQHLREGRSVGIFPEGTINRDPLRLLKGRTGAARLSLETGIPIVPAGLRFPTSPATGRIREGSIMEMAIGAPLTPPPCPGGAATLAGVRAWHGQIMTAISALSRKSWQFERQDSDENDQTGTDQACEDGSRPPEGARRSAIDLPGRKGLGGECRPGVPRQRSWA